MCDLSESRVHDKKNSQPASGVESHDIESVATCLARHPSPVLSTVVL